MDKYERSLVLDETEFSGFYAPERETDFEFDFLNLMFASSQFDHEIL